MRYFKLLKGDESGELDITTQSIFFHDIDGIGYEEDSEFRALGDVFWLNETSYQQGTVSGKLCFTEYGNDDPYVKYQRFISFIADPPLILAYYPMGINGEAYKRRVRVNRIGKTEKNTYGVLDVDVEFICYTPWYKEVSVSNLNAATVENTKGWVWGGPNSDPLVWRNENEEGEEEQEGVTRPRFRGEVMSSVTLKNVETNNKNPVQLTIFGPATSPSWVHYVNSEIVSSGGFSSPVTVEADEKLVVDNTDGEFTIRIFKDDGSVRNIYALRNFDIKCFMYLQKGANRITVSSLDNHGVKIEVKGHVYYATV